MSYLMLEGNVKLDIFSYIFCDVCKHQEVNSPTRATWRQEIKKSFRALKPEMKTYIAASLII
jgi:hypothetical protein